MQIKKFSNIIGNILLSVMVLIVIMELIRSFVLNIPQYRYLQLIWHITHKSTILENGYKFKLPINWTIKDKKLNQYVLQADLREDKSLQTAILYKKLSSNADEELFDDCSLKNQVTRQYQITDNKIQMYWCKDMFKGGSLALFRSEDKKINLLVYDYTPNDYANVKLLFQGVSLLQN